MIGRSRRRGAWVLVAFVVCAPGFAQEDAQPIRPLRTAQAVGKAPWGKETLDRLRQAYFRFSEGASDPLRDEAEVVLRALRLLLPLDGGLEPPRCSAQGVLVLEGALFRVVMVDGESDRVISFFLGQGVDPHAGDVLVGDRKAPFCQVFLSAHPYTTAVSTYRFEREKNPLLALIPAALQSLDLLRLSPSETLTLAEARAPVVWAQIDEIPIPFSRASVSVTEKATTEQPPDMCRLGEAANTLAERLLKRHQLFCPVAGALAEAMREQIATLPAATSTCTEGSEFPACRWSELDRHLSGAYEQVKDGDRTGATCAEALLDVDRGFRDLVSPPVAAEAMAEGEFRIHPRERFSLGVTSAVVLKAWDADDRATLDTNVLTADPLTGALLLTLVNIHPWAYDPGRRHMSLAEQFRLFAGAAVAPYWGPAAGVGLAPIPAVRGLSLNAGFALLRIDRLPEGKDFGDEAEGLRSGWGKAFFVGLSYNFEP